MDVSEEMKQKVDARKEKNIYTSLEKVSSFISISRAFKKVMLLIIKCMVKAIRRNSNI